MDNQFWSRTSKRLDNPTLKSKSVTNILLKQPQQQQSAKYDFNKQVKLYERDPSFVRRSVSQYIHKPIGPNPENTNNKIQKSGSSRMSNLGSSSLAKLEVLQNDVAVYQKQRRGREFDIISQVPRQYKDVIKVFPKYRFETLDNDYWRRKSFIQGLPQNAYDYYSSNNYKTSSSKIETIGRLSAAVDR